MTLPIADALVFFGATGDLAYKKIYPALHEMIKRGTLDMPIIGVANAGWDTERLRARIRDSLEKHGSVDAAAFSKLSSIVHYVDGDYNDAATFQALRKQLGSALRPAHYLAIPPVLFETVVRQLASAGSPKTRGSLLKNRLGPTARLHKSSIGYCSKSFPSCPFSAWTISWENGRSAMFTSALPTRSSSPFGTATMSKVSKSRWPRILASMAAEHSTINGGDARCRPKPCVSDPGQSGDGTPGSHRQRVYSRRKGESPEGDPAARRAGYLPRAVNGYRAEKGVRSDSTVETFVALRLHIDSWRWKGVPFYIRAGKCLPVTCTEVFVRLHKPPTMYSAGPIAGNHLRFRVSPDVSLSLGMMVMAPGEDLIGQPVELLGSRRPVADEPDAYERVLGDAIEGDTTLFARADYVDEAWRIVDPVLKSPSPIYEYDANSWGPSEVGDISPAGGWHNPVVEVCTRSDWISLAGRQ